MARLRVHPAGLVDLDLLAGVKSSGEVDRVRGPELRQLPQRHEYAAARPELSQTIAGATGALPMAIFLLSFHTFFPMTHGHKVVIVQFLRKKAVLINGWLNSRMPRDTRNYDDSEWWDRRFYTTGISDRQTISSNKHRLSSAYHYCSVEQRILRHLFNSKVQQRPALLGKKATDSNLFSTSSILDIGSGSGHWIDFYRALGAGDITGIDVSRSAIKHLQDKYESDEDIKIIHGKALDFLKNTEQSFNVINAIGVMFHIVDDTEWAETIQMMASRLSPDGTLIIGEYFGWIDGLNVQVDEDGCINKRLRSIWKWRRTLRKAGLGRTCLYRNRAYLFINDPLPEASVLIAENH